MQDRLSLHILASGSKGNATVVEGPEGSVLIDCGLSRRSLMERADELGVDMGRISAVFLTHEHSDHVGGLSVFCNRFSGGLYSTAGTIAARSYLSDLPFTLISANDAVLIGGMRVRTFHTSHDVADPFGLRFDLVGDGGELLDSIGYCTDTGVLTEEALDALENVRILALESNHDRRMLAEGPYPAFLKRRVGGDFGHLSNLQAAEAARQLIGPDTETFVAMHLSEKNNRPSVCIRTLAEALGAEAADSTFTEARRADGLRILAASQNRPLTVR